MDKIDHESTCDASHGTQDHKYRQEQEYWLDDQNAEESLKNLIISRVDDIYLDELKEPRF